MIVSYKYHLVSLAAVFLALAVGILIGSNLVGSEALVQQQNSLVTQLEQDFKKLRLENDELHSQLMALTEQLEEAEKKVKVVETSNDEKKFFHNNSLLQ